MSYRIVRYYERFYVERLGRNKFFLPVWRRISPRCGFDTAMQAEEWWKEQRAERKKAFEVVKELP